MHPRNAPPKKPSGGRPLGRRLMSRESLQSNISSGSSDTPFMGNDVESRGPARGPLSLRLMEQARRKGSSSSDTTGPTGWSGKALVGTPESEPEYLSYGLDATISASEDKESLPGRGYIRPLPLPLQPRPPSPSWTDQSVITPPESGSDTAPVHADVMNVFSDETSSIQRSRKPQALRSRTRSGSTAPSDRPTVRSPRTEDDAYATSTVPEKAKSSPKQRSLTSLAPVSRSPSRADAPPSPSKARWDHLRQHVLPSSTISQATPPPSATSTSYSSTVQQVPRSQTSKPSRFGLRGFRQVVEQVRDAAIVDGSDKFADEILKACWQSRFTDPTRGNSYLPFVSTTSLVDTNDNSSTLNQQSQRRAGMNRPSSMQSVVTSRQGPTIKYIHAILLHYATPSTNQPSVGSFLPHESQVLSALLTPLTTRTSGKRADEERWFSIESFEVAVKTWKAATNQVSWLHIFTLIYAYRSK